MKKKFSSMWRVAIALVMVLSLSLVMAVPAVEASPDYIGVEFQTEGDGTAVWSTTEKHSGSHSALLNSGTGGDVANAARVTVPYNAPLNTITSISFWMNIKSATLETACNVYAERWADGVTKDGYYGAYIILELDRDGNGVKDDWLVLAEYGEASINTWVERSLANGFHTSTALPGAPTGQSHWHSVFSSGLATSWTDPTVEPEPYPYGTLAQWQGTTLGAATVLKVKIAVGEWLAANVEVYIDNLIINTVTYDLEKLFINSPTTASPAYLALLPGYASVQFTFTPEAGSASADIQIYKGINVIGSKSVSYTGLTSGQSYTKTEGVLIPVGTAEGKYDVFVGISDGVLPATTTQTDAVVLDWTPPTVAITVNTLINEASTDLKVIATFSEAMDTGVTPTISFDPDVVSSGTLTFSSDAWSTTTYTNDTYTATYTVADVNEEQAGVDVSVGGAKDLASNPQDPDPTTTANLFDVDTIGPTLDSIAWTDVDGSTDIGAGDTLLFTFSEAMDTSTVTAGTLSAALPLSAGSYGTATVDWTTPAGDDTLTVTLGTGVDIASGTTVTPAAVVTDVAGNSATDTQTIIDNVGPVLLSIVWWDKDASGELSDADTLVFTFSEPMDTTTLDSAGEIDTNLPPASTYDATDFPWTVDDTVLTVTLGASVDVVKTDTVDPTDAVKDKAGNLDETDPAVGITQGAIISIELSPATQITVDPQGGTFVATVTISYVVDFDTAAYDVTFDKTTFGGILEVTDVTEGTIASTIPVTQWIQTTDGIRVVQNVVGTPGVTGSGSLAVIHFTFIGPSGTDSDINLVNVMLGDKDGLRIAAEISTTLPVNAKADLVVGDANGDGVVNILDITYIEHVIAGTIDYEPYPGGDANQDGYYNVLDITSIEMIVAGV